MAASDGGTHRDGNGESSHGVLASTAEREDCATTGLRGVTHGDGNNEPNSGADRLAAEPIDRNPS
jgi:hypothetical protein